MGDVRPVRAPDAPHGRGLEQASGVRHGVFVWWLSRGKSIGPRKLDPSAVSDQANECLEARVVQGNLGDWKVPHVIDHKRDWKCRDRWRQFRQAPDIEKELEMPSHFLRERAVFAQLAEVDATAIEVVQP